MMFDITTCHWIYILRRSILHLSPLFLLQENSLQARFQRAFFLPVRLTAHPIVPHRHPAGEPDLNRASRRKAAMTLS
jgi:hypothetical protein